MYDFFHNSLLFFVIFIGVVIIISLGEIVVTFSIKTNPIADKFTHFTLLEIVWANVLTVILLLISVPSFTFLYFLYGLITPVLTLKTSDH
jgi:heme/copper-type cytochrome/quinol oxidase subunit 2